MAGAIESQEESDAYSLGTFNYEIDETWYMHETSTLCSRLLHGTSVAFFASENDVNLLS
jgi:hypothetical protein